MRHDSSFNFIDVLSVAQRLGERIRTPQKAQKRSLAGLESACRMHRQTFACLAPGDPSVSIGVFLSVLEASRERFSAELLGSQPDTTAHLRARADVPLEGDF